MWMEHQSMTTGQYQKSFRPLTSQLSRMVTLECVVVGAGCVLTVDVCGDVAALREVLHESILRKCYQELDPCAMKLYLARIDGNCLSPTAVRHLQRGEIPMFLSSVLTQRNLMNPSDHIGSQQRTEQSSDRVDVLVLVPDNVKTLLRTAYLMRKLREYRGMLANFILTL